ncbi:hypothetical protein Glove_207g8 [Diversispora epigaea]|uniref:DNA polymerase delta catalytic subunit n=1 Tax=Diversispora epigaea TaxID=1348612 RepID=A0A397ITV7_9GLOM|nr:hypothetical protein Glove_207g8 [Diversispora epigaea]
MTTQSEHDTPTVPAYTEESEIQCSVSSDTPTEISIPENQEQCEETYTPESLENAEEYEPENGGEGNGGTYYQGTNAFPQSQISESKEVSQAFHYNGEDYLPTRPSRNMMIAENNDYGSTATINRDLITRKDIPFMSCDIEEYNEYINNTPYYVLQLYGYLVNGQKAVVTVSSIKVFFDIRISDNKSIGIFETEIKNILVNGKNDEGETVDMAELQIEHIKTFPIRGYYVEKKPYLRIVTTNIKQRKIALNIILEYNSKNEKKLETASDDTTSIYYRKVAREYRIPLSGWALITNYEYNNYRVSYSARSPFCKHAFYVSINNYRSVEDPSILYNSYPSQLITHDRALVIAWDIETHTTRGLEYICLVDVETVPDPNWITIICGNEKNLLKAFALCWRALAPDIELIFNGSKYDWPFVVERATQHKILDWMVAKMSANPRKKATIDSILRWNYYGGLVNLSVKISSIKRCVPIDVVVCCKKLYLKSEKKSLNHFLKINGLDSKIDLPIKTMRKYYTQSNETTTPETTENIHKVAEYCIVDSRSCQSLMVKNNVINDYRDVASIAYVSLFDSHYYAVGMKVRNLLGVEAWKRDILIIMISSGKTGEDKFSGAYVFSPDKGLEDKYPVTGLDFASLYPSIIMNYNLSPEKMTLLTEEAGALEKAGEILHKIEFPFNSKTLYAWSIRHGNKDNKKGLYSSVLEELLNKRNKMKSQLGILGKIKEYMELVIGKIEEENLSVVDAIDYILKNAEDEEKHVSMNGILIPLINETYEKFIVEYNSICFDYTYLDSKQKAVKLYMNSFYGEMGNGLSPFFFLHLAGGVTSAGKHNIKLVAEYVIKKGFGIKYGDTDSLYFTCPFGCYKECNLAYNNGKDTITKLEYWTEIVKITMGVIEKIRNNVNSYLRLKNKSTYLKMAYEEVLFPVCFTGKKKYFGIEHKDKPNFGPTKKLFIRRIDTVKQEVLKEAVFNPKQWDFKQFIETDAWKPDKNNIRVQNFIKRMRKKYENKIPDPGERFSCVVVQFDRFFDLKGNKLKLRKSDQMEFVDVAKEQGKSIDLSHYFGNSIIELCARFIMYDKKYEPLPSDKIMKITDLDEKYKQIDTYAQEKAKKWLESYIKEINVVDRIDSKIISNRGYAYKRAYKNAVKEGRGILSKKIGNIYEALQGNCINYEHFICGDPISEIWENLVKYIETIKREELDIKKLKRIEILISPDIEDSICSNLMKHIDSVKKIAIEYNPFFHRLVYHMRYKEHTVIPDKIGAFETMRKKEMIIDQPTLPYISEADRLILESFQNTWKESVNIFYASCEVKIC